MSNKQLRQQQQQQRLQEINAVAASCKITLKAPESHDGSRVVTIQSEDGSSKNVVLLTKTPYIRPQQPKIMCNQCNERPNGFRGTHELDRHIARAHAPSRKGFVCVDASPNKRFLAKCKHCCNQKAYGAYYNAAAHLRRAHFHPRKRGPKGKRNEKRGGISGGDDPPMDTLKQLWIREVEVAGPKPSLSPAESASDDVEATYEVLDEYMDTSPPGEDAGDMGSNHDASYESMETFPRASNMSNPISSTQFVEHLLNHGTGSNSPAYDLSDPISTSQFFTLNMDLGDATTYNCKQIEDVKACLPAYNMSSPINSTQFVEHRLNHSTGSNSPAYNSFDSVGPSQLVDSYPFNTVSPPQLPDLIRSRSMSLSEALLNCSTGSDIFYPSSSYNAVHQMLDVSTRILISGARNVQCYYQYPQLPLPEDISVFQCN